MWDGNAIGIDLGGSQLRVARVSAVGKVLAAKRCATDRAGGPEAVIAQMLQMAQHLDDGSVTRMGVGIPGTIEAASGVVLNIPALPGWVRFPLAERLQGALGHPCRLENDAKAATLGEWQAGAGQGLQNFVYVTISTGIGSAAVMDGRLLRGKGGLAGEIGHTKISDSPVTCACGLTGCWQATASGAGLDLQAQRIARDDPRGATAQAAGAATPTGVHLGRAAQDGDPTARAALDGHARLLGQGLTNLQHVYSPEVIVMGGGVSALLEPMRRTIEDTMRERLLPGFTPALIKGAALGEDAGLIGAALGERVAP